MSQPPATPERPPRMIPGTPRHVLSEEPTLSLTPFPVRVPPAHLGRGPSTAHGGTGPLQRDELTYLWATGIAVETFKEIFREYLETYRPLGAAPSAPPYFYMAMKELRLSDGHTLELNFTEFAATCPMLYHQVVGHPGECLQMMSQVADSIYTALFTDLNADFQLQVAPKHLPFTLSLRSLSQCHIETLVAVRGLVIRTSKLIPEVRVAHFRCWVCRNTETSVADRGRIFEPVRCQHCGKQYTYELIHNLSLFEDKQIVRVQEAPENLADGETPVTVSVVVYGEMADTVVPGDRVTVTGILRADPLKLNQNTRITRAIFRTHIDAVHIETNSPHSKSEEVEARALEQGTIDALHNLSCRPDIYDILERSLAPTIWGLSDVKNGILAQLFAGTRKDFKHGKFRSELNIILCGDPGVAKSQLLSQVHKISPRGVYTSGKGSSSVGLTAFVTRDPDTNEFVMEPGALVLSDRGICCIDEFDKMDDSTRSILHEVMEQQTLSVAKAGIVAQLNARTSILAAANPKESQWNPSLNIVENLQIEPTLLSRFDLIFLVLDKNDEAEDRKLASHILSLYMEHPASPSGALDSETTEPQSPTARPANFLLDGPPSRPILSVPRFSQYVAYARAKVLPKISEEAHRALTNAYVDLRRQRSGGKTVVATLRQLESMIRLSEARAKMRLAEVVTSEDVKYSLGLIRTALKEAATDPRTGLINMDIFTAPDLKATTIESCMVRMQRIIQTKYLALGKKSASMQELRQALNETLVGQRSVAMNQFTEMLALMAGGDTVATFTPTMVTFVT